MLQRKSKSTFHVQLLFFFFENRALYEIMWKNIVERASPVDNVARTPFILDT
jgi:hypothetical protein